MRQVEVYYPGNYFTWMLNLLETVCERSQLLHVGRELAFLTLLVFVPATCEKSGLMVKSRFKEEVKAILASMPAAKLKSAGSSASNLIFFVL